jgi:hypothetical protein
MVWRGSADYKDRLFGALVYLFAVYDAVVLGGALPAYIPAVAPLFNLLNLLLLPISFVYGIFNAILPLGLGSLVVFFILWLAVVQNAKISYFIRFNTLQSILIGILIALVQIILQTLSGLDLIGGAGFFVAIAACFYCIGQCILGRYPEIPSISEAVYSQLPR